MHIIDAVLIPNTLKVQVLSLLGVTAQPTLMDAFKCERSCFDGIYDCETCCTTGLGLNGASCWDGIYTPESCCGGPVRDPVQRVVLNIAELVVSLPELSILASVLEETGLMVPLSGSELTLFAPTNDAFESNMPEGVAEFLLDPKNRPTLEKVLRYHVVPRRLRTEDMKSDEVPVPTFGTSTLVDDEMIYLSTYDPRGIRVVDGGVSTAWVTRADLLATNGALHLIDAVLVPPNLKDTVLGVVAAPPTIPNLASSMASLTPPSETSPCSGKSNLEGDSHCEFWVGEDARKCESTNYYQLNCALKCCEINPPPQIPTITFVSLLETAGLVETLSGGELTVFAP